MIIYVGDEASAGAYIQVNSNPTPEYSVRPIIKPWIPETKRNKKKTN